MKGTSLLQSLLLGVLCLVSTLATRVSGEDLTADDILERNRKAMAPPIQYRITTGAVENVVSIKQIGGLGPAVRVDTVTPLFERGSLAVGSEYWTWDAGLKTGSKLSDAMAAAQATAMRLSAAVRESMPDVSVLSIVRDSVTRDGKRCLVVDEVMPEEWLQSVMKDAPPGTRIPGGTRLVVDAESFLTIEKTPLVDSKGTPGEPSVVTDVRLNADLPDELFLPPDGYQFTVVGSLSEAENEAERRFFAKAKTEMEARSKAIEEQIQRDIENDPIRRDPVTGEILRDPKTGHAVLRAPPGFDEEEYNREVTRIVMEHRLRTGNQDPADPALVKKIIELDASRTTKAGVTPPTQAPSPAPLAPEALPKPSRFSRAFLVNMAIVFLLAGLLYWRWGRQRS